MSKVKSFSAQQITSLFKNKSPVESSLTDFVSKEDFEKLDTAFEASLVTIGNQEEKILVLEAENERLRKQVKFMHENHIEFSFDSYKETDCYRINEELLNEQS